MLNKYISQSRILVVRGWRLEVRKNLTVCHPETDSINGAYEGSRLFANTQSNKVIKSFRIWEKLKLLLNLILVYIGTRI